MGVKILNTHILEKRGSSTDWAASNYIPKNGERILVDFYDSGVYKYTREKIGDGVTTYNRLPFLDEGLVHADIYKNKIHADIAATDDDIIILTPNVTTNDQIAAVNVSYDAKHAKIGPTNGFTSTEVTDLSVENGDTILVPSLTVDEYGHINAISETSLTFNMGSSVSATGDDYITAGVENSIVKISHKETLDAETSVTNTTTSIGAGESKTIKIPNVVVDEAGHIKEITESLVQISVPVQDGMYRGTVSSLEELPTDAKRGDFVRVTQEITNGVGIAHFGDILIAEVDNPSQDVFEPDSNNSSWTIIHCHLDTDTDTYLEVHPGVDNENPAILFEKYINGGLDSGFTVRFTSTDGSVVFNTEYLDGGDTSYDLSVKSQVERLTEEDITDEFNSIFGTDYVYEAVTV